MGFPARDGNLIDVRLLKIRMFGQPGAMPHVGRVRGSLVLYRLAGFL